MSGHSLYRRSCACAHGFPVCACVLGHAGRALLVQSRRLSALADWPGRVTAEAAARVLPRPAPAAALEALASVRACPHWTAASDCGCGLNRCALGRGDRGAVSHRDCLDCLGLL